MIPLIIGGAVTAGLGLLEKSCAKDMQKEAEETLEEAQEMYEASKGALEQQQIDTEISLKALGNKKYDLLTGLITEFIVAFNTFKNVDFQQMAGINELDNMKFETFDENDFISIKELSDIGKSLTKGVAAGTAAGSMLALGIGSSWVGGIGSVAAISGLSGGLAGIGTAAQIISIGLGGLAPTLGVIAGPALLVGGFASCWKASENLDKAKTAYAETEVACEQMDTSTSICKQIEKRSYMFYDLLNELEPLLKSSVQELSRIAGTQVQVKIPKKRGALTKFFANLFNIQLKEKFVTKTLKKNNYNILNENEKKILAMSGSIAKAVKTIIDTPILNEEGNLTKESKNICEDISNQLPEYQSNQLALIG